MLRKLPKYIVSLAFGCLLARLGFSVNGWQFWVLIVLFNLYAIAWIWEDY